MLTFPRPGPKVPISKSSSLWVTQDMLCAIPEDHFRNGCIAWTWYEHNRFNAILPKVASAGLAIYSDLHSAILHTPSTPSTRGLARDGATSSPKTSNSWGQHWQRLQTSPSTVPAGGQPLLLVPSPRPRGKSLIEVSRSWMQEWESFPTEFILS